MTSPIPSNWELPEAIRRRVGQSAGKQRVLAEEGHVLLILHALPRADDPRVREPRLFWRLPDGSIRAATRESGTGIASLRAHVEGFYAAVESLEDRVEQAGDADAWFALLHELAPFLRTTRNMARALQELRDVVGPDKDLVALRDRAQDVERAAELVHQWASQGLDYTIAKTNEEQARLSDFISRASHRLNLLAALTLPVTAIGSFFGVNLASGFETRSAPYLFWIVGLISIALGLAIRSSMPALPAVDAPAKPPIGVPPRR